MNQCELNYFGKSIVLEGTVDECGPILDFVNGVYLEIDQIMRDGGMAF